MVFGVRACGLFNRPMEATPSGHLCSESREFGSKCDISKQEKTEEAENYTFDYQKGEAQKYDNRDDFGDQDPNETCILKSSVNKKIKQNVCGYHAMASDVTSKTKTTIGTQKHGTKTRTH